MKPARYQHDCDHCIYIGQINNLDAYYCPNDSGTCYILRYGDEGCEYAARSDYRNKEYTELAKTIGFSESFSAEWIERFLRRSVLLRLLTSTLAESMEVSEV